MQSSPPHTQELNGIEPLVSWRKLEVILGCDRRLLRRIADQAARYYQPFDRRKTAGAGKWRHIDNPKEELKSIQRAIQKRLLANISLPTSMVGGVSGRSTIDHARSHVRKQCVVTLDIKECFPSISNQRVFGIFRHHIGMSPEIARTLTQLTTLQHRLPQGAPSSPTLANLALLPLHGRLLSLAQDLGLAMSMYVDDIAFSGDEAEKVIEPACRLIQAHGFGVSWKKLSIQSRDLPQHITGLQVNQRIDLTKEFRSSILKEIQILADAEVVYQRELNSVWGRIRYAKHIRPAIGLALEEFALRCLPGEGSMGGLPKWEVRPCTRFSRNHAG